MEIVPLRMPSRTQNSWALEGKQRKPERGREREENFWKDRGRKKEEEGQKTWGFYVKEGICVKCILCNETPQFCSFKQRYLELENKNLFSCPSPVETAVLGLQRAYPPFHKNTPILYFVRFRHCVVVKRGCHFRAPAKRWLCLLGHTDTER